MKNVTDNLPLDVLVDELRSGEQTWATLTLRDRRDLLHTLINAVEEHSAEWIDIARHIKQLPGNSPFVGEEWLSGPYALLAGAHALSASLATLDVGESPIDGYHLDNAPGERIALRVLPHNVFDRLLLNGFTVDVWSQPGISEDTFRHSAGLGQRTPHTTGGIGVVLGAGNIFSIAPLDTLYELFAHNRVVLLKLNPLTDPLLPVLDKVFSRFIALGLIKIITGGVDIGTAAINHPGINHVHITGSINSHDAIVFGGGPEGAERKRRRQPLLNKPITSELGGVCPTIVVPGKWSKRDLTFQAEHIVTQKLHNNGYNCIASQVLVVSDDWEQKDAFLDAIRQAYATAATRAAYYPGSNDRTAAAIDTHDTAESADNRSRVLIEIDSSSDDIAFREEYFAPVLVVTTLPGHGQQFLDTAVEFANHRLTGTLGANLVIHPRTICELGAEFSRAVADLRYGTIGVNAWTGLGYLTARATWGAFPGHTPHDAQSGIGVVHNGLLLDHIERTVVRGPFRPFPRSVFTGQLTISPRPPWFVTNRTAATTARRLTSFTARPSWGKLPAIFISALRG